MTWRRARSPRCPSIRASVRSQGAVKRIARAGVALLVARREPSLSLGGRHVRPRLGVHAPLELLLDAVVSDRGGGVKRRGDVVLLERLQEAGRRGVVGPD